MATRRAVLKMFAGTAALATAGLDLAVSANPENLLQRRPILAAAKQNKQLFIVRGVTDNSVDIEVYDFLQGEQLGTATKVSQNVPTNGPVSLYADSKENLWLATTGKQVHSHGTYSFELDPESKDYHDQMKNKGLKTQDAPTSGTGEFLETSSAVTLLRLDVKTGNQPTQVITLGGDQVHLEPIGIIQLDGKHQLLATSSGQYGREVNLADEVLMFELPLSSSLSDKQLDGTIVLDKMGHSANRFAIVKSNSSPTRLIVSKDNGDIEVDLGSGNNQSRLSEQPAKTLRHDRIPIANSDSVLTVIYDDLVLIEKA